MSDPNSQHQKWSKWTWSIRPGRQLVRPLEEVTYNIAKAFRTIDTLKAFFRVGSQVRIQSTVDGYTLEILAEGIDAHDPSVVEFIRREMTILFVNGFGVDTQVTQSVKWMAGDKEDGKPRDQMLILPRILDTRVWEEVREPKNQTLGMPNIADTRLWGSN